VKQHGHPAEGRHSLQIEINRKLHMNEETLEEHAGLDLLRRDLNELSSSTGGARARADY
jgi:N-formylglutamate deformylase